MNEDAARYTTTAEGEVANQEAMEDIRVGQVRRTFHAKVEHDFTYHPPKADQVPKFEAIREDARQLGHTLVEMVPPSLELEDALRLLNLAVMSANAGIARRS